MDNLIVLAMFICSLLFLLAIALPTLRRDVTVEPSKPSITLDHTPPAGRWVVVSYEIIYQPDDEAPSPDDTGNA